MTLQSRQSNSGPFRVGDRIIEKQHNAHEKRVIEVVPDQYIVCKGLTRTRISWRNLGRYRLLERRVVLRVQSWHTECGACGYGRGGWASSPARNGLPVLTPQSRTCHGCGERFTHVESPYEGTVTVLSEDEQAA